MLITAVMMRHQRKLVRAFQHAGAVSAAEALTPAQLGLQPGMAWHRLVSLGVLRCPAQGRYFLDMANWQRLRHRRRAWALAVIAALLLLPGLVWLLSRAG